jgi:hypothetical protein
VGKGGKMVVLLVSQDTVLQALEEQGTSVTERTEEEIQMHLEAR